MPALAADLRYALRQLRRAPGFTVAAVACLGLGIGATTAVFGFARALLAPVPHLAEPERLVRAFVEWDNGLEFGAFSYPDYRDLRDGNRTLAGLAVETPTPFQLAAGGRAERLWGSLVSGDYFSLLGLRMARGRGFLPEEDRAPRAAPVAVVSHGLWQRRFGGDPALVGREITLNGHPFTVVGVAPPGFAGANAALESRLWVPMAMQEVAAPGSSLFEARAHHWIGFAIGRLAPGVSLAEAEADLAGVMSRIAEAHPQSHRGAGIALYPEARASLHPYVRPQFVGFLGLLAGVVGLILLLASANVAGLLLARGLARRREIAVRLALGAPRGRLVRQLLAESLLLAAAGAAAGVALALGLARALAALELPDHLPLGVAVGIDVPLVAFAVAAAAATVVLCGLAPALAATRPQLAPALKEGGGTGGGTFRRPGGRLRPALVVAQVALSAMLLLGAAFALESLGNARRIDLGFEPAGQLIASMDVTLQGYDPQEGRRFFRDLADRVAALPGVETLGYGKLLPLGLRTYQAPVEPEGWAGGSGGEGAGAPPSIDYNFAGPGYLQATGVALVAGRGFAEGDEELTPLPALVNRTFAERFWGEPPAALGRSLRVFEAEHRVVGVVADTKIFRLGEEPRPYLLLPLDRYYRGDRTLHVRTAGEPAALAAAVRREVAALDPDLPLYNLEPMEEHLSLALLPARLAAAVTGALAAVALLLAAVGLYGVIAFWVGRRRHELGVRRALGAPAGTLAGLVVRQAAGLAGAGLALGLAGGAVLAHLAGRLLHGVSAAAPGAYAAVAAVLAGAALAAALVPARRAARTDPAAALRAE